MSKRKGIIMGAVGAALLAATAIASDAATKYEEPNYKSTLKEGQFEVREYPSGIAASVEVNNGDKAANEAFKILAGFIFGKNKSKQKIAMTVPVTEAVVAEKIAMTAPVTTKTSADKMVMTFYMPSKYTMESLPEPSDSRIQISQTAVRKYAVVKFSGLATKRALKQQEEKLRTWMKEKNLEGTGDALDAFYNPPWTLPFLRRNEIWISL